MRIYKLFLLRPTVDGYHDALGYMCGSVLLPGPTAIPRISLPDPSAVWPSPNPNKAHPIVWRTPFPKDIVDSLVSWTNPQGIVKNSELKLAGGIIHSDCVAQCFVVTECTILSCTENTAGLWWQRKGSATCTSSPAHLLRLQAMHQWFHRYVPCIDFVSRVDNLISDRPYRLLYLTDNQILAYLDTNFPQPLPWQLWTPPPRLVSRISSVLRQGQPPYLGSLCRILALCGHPRTPTRLTP